jgi:CsoR family transcriptional regulator, copper-sensing transcriptional repressor
MKAKNDKKKDRKSEVRVQGEFADEHIKRINRITGQLEGIQNMIISGRELDDILAQCKAVHSALKSVEVKLLKRHIEARLSDMERVEKRKDREAAVDELLELFRPVF